MLKMTAKSVFFLMATLASGIGIAASDADTPRIINAETLQSLSTESMRYDIPNNSPCSDQPTSYEELEKLYKHGRIPSVSEVSGTWVAIGFYHPRKSYPGGAEAPSVNCSGVKRGNILEWVMTANQYSIEIDMLGTYLQSLKMERNKKKELTFSPDLGGDGLIVYRCRLSSRKTLICLGPYNSVEFKKLRVEDYQRASKAQRNHDK